MKWKVEAFPPNELMGPFLLESIANLHIRREGVTVPLKSQLTDTEPVPWRTPLPATCVDDDNVTTNLKFGHSAAVRLKTTYFLWFKFLLRTSQPPDKQIHFFFFFSLG